MKKIILTSLFFLIPTLVFAFPANLGDFIKLLLSLIDIIIPIMSGFIMIIFFYGTALFILAQGDIVKTQTGKSFMLWSVLGIFLLVSLWGIIQVMSNELDFGQIRRPTLPTN